MENDNKALERDSLQYNAQDLQQEQNMDLNPVQNNAQTVQVIVNDEKDNSGKISGVTYYEKMGQIIGDVHIFLFFGYDSNVPVYRTKSDSNGNYGIEDLPPGFYSVKAHHGERETRLEYIKLLPGQKVTQNILL